MRPLAHAYGSTNVGCELCVIRALAPAAGRGCRRQLSHSDAARDSAAGLGSHLASCTCDDDPNWRGEVVLFQEVVRASQHSLHGARVHGSCCVISPTLLSREEERMYAMMHCQALVADANKETEKD